MGILSWVITPYIFSKNVYIDTYIEIHISQNMCICKFLRTYISIQKEEKYIFRKNKYIKYIQKIKIPIKIFTNIYTHIYIFIHFSLYLYIFSPDIKIYIYILGRILYLGLHLRRNFNFFALKNRTGTISHLKNKISYQNL